MTEQVFQPTQVSDLVTTPSRAAVEIERIGPAGAATNWWATNKPAIGAALAEECPRGKPHGYAVLFGRMPGGAVRPPWCVESIRYQWSESPGGWKRIFTPSGRAADAMEADTAREWLAARPAGARWVMLSTQHGLLLSSDTEPVNTWHWLAMLASGDRPDAHEWPRPWDNEAAQLGIERQTLGSPDQFGDLYRVVGLPFADFGRAGLVIDDETKLVPSPDMLPLYQDGRLLDLLHEAGLSESQGHDALAGKYATGAFRADIGQQRLTDTAHRTLARMLGWALLAHSGYIASPLCASNHGSTIPCVLASGHGASYTASPWGYGAPLESRRALCSVKLYGGSWQKPGVWQPTTRTHTIKAAEPTNSPSYADGMAYLAARRACSAVWASRQRFGVWLQCNAKLSPWMLATQNSRKLFRLAWLLTASGGTIFISTDGDDDHDQDYAKRWFDELALARAEVLGKIGGAEVQVIADAGGNSVTFAASNAVVTVTG